MTGGILKMAVCAVWYRSPESSRPERGLVDLCVCNKVSLELKKKVKLSIYYRLIEHPS